MPMPRKSSRMVTPTVEVAFERFHEWPACWLVYGDDSVGWKDPHVSHVFLRIDGLKHLTGDDRYRQYQVKAVKVETAIDRAVELVQCPYELHVTVYKVNLPPTAETRASWRPRMPEFNVTPRGERSVPNPDAWGLDPASTVRFTCPMLVDGECPVGCDECEKFEDDRADK